MNDTPLLDWTPARRRDDGMQRAVDHADAVTPSWSDRAGALLIEYARLRASGEIHEITDGKATFLIEDVRVYAREFTDLPDPPDGRAWGAVVQRAARAKAIHRVGWQEAKSSNLSPKGLWASGRSEGTQ